ncbi:Alpha-L-rhamnosidase N-terminal domain-containing protein [Chitinophaga sp. YR627]|uniref:family 78 glycoside hydrolase catalytic domain n=1 Tax=Chitinophaga sp. YR627 TaxID=1881041 RepID=UPI0008E6542D|nr:family 78 glycoside hydrolase catalytic domain [Chitinophaga sp. YR627]SFN41267.1 Alpha-L-rhamnosidase N-terminal domain-containing protein [Chitinophaga sp. YR627]
MKQFTGILLLFLSLQTWAQQLEVVHLRTDNKTNPLGCQLSPRLSWQLSAQYNNCIQQAYQLQFSDDSTTLNNKLHTGKRVENTAPFFKLPASFAGVTLLPARTYYWRVQVWDKDGKASGWSKVASFTTALSATADWKGAKWIGYEDVVDSMRVVPGVHNGTDKFYQKHKARQRTVVPLFRKEFSVRGKVKNALLYISGLGQYEASLNGVRLGDNFLAPGWTHYDETVLYNTYDLTKALQSGENALGVIVGNGFFNVNKERYRKLSVVYGMPRMICRLLITYENGQTMNIVSGTDWKTSASPITFTSIYGGEDYDAGKEQTGWDRPGFNDTQWKPAMVVKATEKRLLPEEDYPVKVMEVLRVQRITQPQTGVYMYDFGQNASGIIGLKIKGKKGQTVKLIPAELTNDKQLANQKATGSPYYFTYTLKGDGIETWQPRFTYYGFRYVQVEGAAPDTAAYTGDVPQLLSLDLLHTRNAAPVNGTFSCSNDLFNSIHKLILWAIKSNMQSVLTDCPHREKLSWLEQDYLMGNAIQYSYDIDLLYRKLIRDMKEAQTSEGLVPDIAPEFVFFDDHGFGFRDSPEWGSAAVIVPWLLYRWYGDNTVIREAYPMVKKYVEYLGAKAQNNILSYGLGDWFDNGPQRPGVAQLTPKEVTATGIYYYDLVLAANMADLLDKTAEAKQFRVQADKVKHTFNHEYFNVETKVYSTGSQTAMAIPLCVGLVDEQYRQAVFKNMVDSIRQQGNQLTAGDIGFHFLVQALQEGGASDLLYEMNNRSGVPGYGFQLAKGATTLTESWAALEQVSNNHLMLGHLMEWFYTGLGGITQQAGSVGYKQFQISPEIVGNITWVKTAYNTPYGTIRSEWEKKDGKLLFRVSIPPNSSAVVKLPAKKEGGITAGGKPLNNQDLSFEKGRVIMHLGSGDYEFSSLE